MRDRSVLLLRLAVDLRVVECLAFDQDVVRIGRGRETDVVLPSPDVSRLHCEIRREGDRYRIRDCDSANGTRLNGKPVAAGTLEPGDHLKIGEYSIWVDVGSTGNGPLPEHVDSDEPTIRR